MTTIEDIKVINFKSYETQGSLIPLDFDKDIPFKVKRMFYVYGVAGNSVRGKHAHFTTKQVLICLSGVCKIICKDGKKQKTITLEDPTKGIYIPEMLWDEQIYTSPETILLVLSSTLYDRDDYIENWKYFERIKTNKN